MYSVFRSQGTWEGRGVDDTDVVVVPFVKGVADAEGSPRRKRSFGSSRGGLSGSGFSTAMMIWANKNA